MQTVLIPHKRGILIVILDSFGYFQRQLLPPNGCCERRRLVVVFAGVGQHDSKRFRRWIELFGQNLMSPAVKEDFDTVADGPETAFVFNLGTIWLGEGGRDIALTPVWVRIG